MSQLPPDGQRLKDIADALETMDAGQDEAIKTIRTCLNTKSSVDIKRAGELVLDMDPDIIGEAIKIAKAEGVWPPLT